MTGVPCVRRIPPTTAVSPRLPSTSNLQLTLLVLPSTSVTAPCLPLRSVTAAINRGTTGRRILELAPLSTPGTTPLAATFWLCVCRVLLATPFVLFHPTQSRSFPPSSPRCAPVFYLRIAWRLSDRRSAFAVKAPPSLYWISETRSTGGLSAKAFPAMDLTQRDLLARDQFLVGLLDPNLCLRVRYGAPTSLKDAVCLALEAHAAETADSRRRVSRIIHYRRFYNVVTFTRRDGHACLVLDESRRNADRSSHLCVGTLGISQHCSSACSCFSASLLAFRPVWPYSC